MLKDLITKLLLQLRGFLSSKEGIALCMQAERQLYNAALSIACYLTLKLNDFPKLVTKLFGAFRKMCNVRIMSEASALN